MDQSIVCEVCGRSLTAGIAVWHRRCLECGTEYSTLKPTIQGKGASVQLDEQRRAEGLAPIRTDVYALVLAELRRLRSKGGGSLLEVGSAHGWFLNCATPDFVKLVGIEPDDGVRASSSCDRVEVRAGYFPSALEPEDCFDVVAFNDVFEHIPSATAVVEAVHRALAPKGIAIVNLPVSGGAIYRASRALYQLGVGQPFERMWQIHYKSPHLYYFSEKSLVRLFQRHGFELLKAVPVPSVRFAGLRARIAYGESSKLASSFILLAALLALPFLAILPMDTKCFFFRKR